MYIDDYFINNKINPNNTQFNNDGYKTQKEALSNIYYLNQLEDINCQTKNKNKNLKKKTLEEYIIEISVKMIGFANTIIISF